MRLYHTFKLNSIDSKILQHQLGWGTSCVSNHRDFFENFALYPFLSPPWSASLLTKSPPPPSTPKRAHAIYQRIIRLIVMFLWPARSSPIAVSYHGHFVSLYKCFGCFLRSPFLEKERLPKKACDWMGALTSAPGVHPNIQKQSVLNIKWKQGNAATDIISEVFVLWHGGSAERKCWQKKLTDGRTNGSHPLSKVMQKW